MGSAQMRVVAIHRRGVQRERLQQKALGFLDVVLVPAQRFVQLLLADGVGGKTQESERCRFLWLLIWRRTTIHYNT